MGLCIMGSRGEGSFVIVELDPLLEYREFEKVTPAARSDLITINFFGFKVAVFAESISSLVILAIGCENECKC